MQLQFRPMQIWPKKLTAVRKTAPFRASYPETLRLLEKELRYLHARAIVIEVAVGADEIRRDGVPYANARPRHPGVILRFNSKHGPLSYPCDTFDDFRDNIRAIALALEYLRAVDRYGVTQRGEQYRGWTALPPPVVDPATSVFSDQLDAAIWVADQSGFGAADILTQGNVWRSAYLALCKKFHPDAGGDAKQFSLLQQARSILDKHHGKAS